MVKNFLFVGCLLVLFSACKPKSNLKANKVVIAGSLSQIMQDDLTAKAELSTLKDEPDVYAIGAMEGLKGEIQILGSKALYSRKGIDGEMLEMDSTYLANAAMLVYTRVPEWQEYEIPKAILTLEQFDNWLYSTASKAGHNMDEPLPFLVHGFPRKLNWHIIDWNPSIGSHSKQNHINSGIQGVFVEEETDIIGFYSRNHKGVFTHHDSNMHMHFVLDNEKLAGHVDQVLFGPYMILKLPKIN